MPKTSDYNTISSLPVGTYVEVIVPMGGGFKNYRIPTEQFKAATISNFAGLSGNPRDNEALEAELEFLQSEIDLLSAYGIIRVWVVGSQSAMLSLDQVKPGDMAYRTDIAADQGKVFDFTGPTSDYSQSARWIQKKKVPQKLQDLDVDIADRDDQKVVYWDEATQKHKYKIDAAGDPSALLSSDAEYTLGTSTTKAPRVKQVKDEFATKQSISEKNANNGYAGLNSSGKLIKALMSLILEDLSSSGADATWSIDKIKSQIASSISTAIANLVDSSPATLDTLNELAAALGDDPNFATTVATAIGLKSNTADVVLKADKSTLTEYRASTSGLWIDADLLYNLIGDDTQLEELGITLYDKLVEVFGRIGRFDITQSGLTINLDETHRSFFVASSITGNATITVSNKPSLGAVVLEPNFVYGFVLITKNTVADCTITVSGGSVVGSNILKGASGSKHWIEYRGLANNVTTNDVFIFNETSSTGGTLTDITQGAGINIDKTNPANPVISATGIPATTDALTEGVTNLYFTNTRARAAITASSEFTYVGGALSVNQIAYSKITGTPTSLPPNGTATGDLTGAYPAPSVAKIRGVSVDAATPIDGDLWQYDSATSKYTLTQGIQLGEPVALAGYADTILPFDHPNGIKYGIVVINMGPV